LVIVSDLEFQLYCVVGYTSDVQELISGFLSALNGLALVTLQICTGLSMYD